MKTYRVKFNDFGEVFIFAENYAEAESTFLKSGDGGETPTIKEIVYLGKGIIGR